MDNSKEILIKNEDGNFFLSVTLKFVGTLVGLGFLPIYGLYSGEIKFEGVKVITGFIVLYALIFLIIFLGIKRSIATHKSYSILLKGEQVLINIQLFCLHSDLDGIIVKKKVSSYNSVDYDIGLHSLKCKILIAFHRNEEETLKLANHLSNYFDKKIIYKTQDSFWGIR